MRKLKLQMQISVDGFVAGPNGEMDWMEWNWGDDIKDYVGAIHANVDTLVLGRNLAQGFIPHWAAAVTKPEENNEFARKMNDAPKIVFSKTLKKSEWDNTQIAGGDLNDEITKLKRAPGADLITYGGAKLVSNLISQNLIDEYHLFINPSSIGTGLAIFQSLQQRLALSLVASRSFSCGIVVLYFEPKK